MRVRAASVDRGTWHLMAGQPKLMRIMGFGLSRPKQPNPGRSLAGVVEAVGEKVTEFDPGDEVFGTCDGSFAEYARARVELLARKPKTLSFEQAATVPVSGMTVLQGVRDRAKVQAGQRVLVIGVSGGVGTFAVQVAKAFGADVTGVCSTSKIDLVRALGADHVIDYTRDDFAEGDPRYDSIIDIGGNSRLSRLRRSLAPGGKLVIVGGETKRTVAGGLRPPAPCPCTLPAGEPEAAHPRCERELGRLVGSARVLRDREGQSGNRPVLPTQRNGGSHQVLTRRTCSRKGRHDCLIPQSLS